MSAKKSQKGTVTPFNRNKSQEAPTYIPKAGEPKTKHHMQVIKKSLGRGK